MSVVEELTVESASHSGAISVAPPELRNYSRPGTSNGKIGKEVGAHYHVCRITGEGPSCDAIVVDNSDYWEAESSGEAAAVCTARGNRYDRVGVAGRKDATGNEDWDPPATDGTDVVHVPEYNVGSASAYSGVPEAGSARRRGVAGPDGPLAGDVVGPKLPGDEVTSRVYNYTGSVEECTVLCRADDDPAAKCHVGSGDSKGDSSVRRSVDLAVSYSSDVSRLTESAKAT